VPHLRNLLSKWSAVHQVRGKDAQTNFPRSDYDVNGHAEEVQPDTEASAHADEAEGGCLFVRLVVCKLQA
jgi:hypothetical protein